ncbi:MAG: FtsX-like permease family protein [Coprobacillus sp.]
MGTLRFSMHMLKKEYQKSLIYTLTLCLTISVTFLFFNIIDNPYLFEETTFTKQGLSLPFSSILSFLVIVFCGFMIIFANNFYISKKTKEIAIMTMSGSSFFGSTLYLFYQNLIMTVIAFPFGIGIGMILSILANQCIYPYIDVAAPMFYIPISAIADTIICVCVIIAAQLIYASGFVYRKDIQYMLSQDHGNLAQDNRIVRIPSYMYVFIYVIGIVMIFGVEYTPTNVLFPCFIGVLGIGGMIKYCFPMLFKRIKSHYFLNNQIRLISISNLYYSLRRAIMLIGLYAISTVLMISIIITQQDSPREMITATIGFVVIVILLLVSIIYKYCMEASTRRVSYYNLYKLGYTYKQLLSIVKQEVWMFYLTIIGLPFVYIMITLILAYTNHVIDGSFLMIIITAMIIPIIIAALFTYVSYKKSVLKTMEEGVRYE